MNKKWIIKETLIILSVMLILNVFAASTGFAKNDDDEKAETRKEKNISNNKNDQNNKNRGSIQPEKSDKSNQADKSIKDDESNKYKKSKKDVPVNKEHDDDKNSDHNEDSNKDDDDSKSSVTWDVYKHHKMKNPENFVPKDLMIAYLKTEGTSVQAIIGDMLINKYSITEIVYSFKNGLGKGKLSVTGNVYSGTSDAGIPSGTVKIIGSNGTGDSTVTGTVYNLSAEFLYNFAKELREQLKVSAQTTLEKADALEQLSEVYDTIGDNENAIEVQKDAIKTNPHNLESYKKLGQLFKNEGKKEIKGFVNGDQVTFDVLPVIQKDRTLVPFRAISESLKAEVSWNPTEKTVTVTKNGIEVKLTIGSKTALVNGKEVALDTPAQVIKDRTFIPVRFLSEAFSADVQWEPATQSVVVNEIK
jgi:tetratricopeptide (TPR) repeat protein